MRVRILRALTARLLPTSGTAGGRRIVFTHSDDRHTQERPARGDGFGHARTVFLDDFAPGGRVLRVDARALASNTDQVFRQGEFTVR